MIDSTIGIATSSTQLPNLFNESAAKRQTLPCQAFSGFARSPSRAKIIVFIPVQGSASCCRDDNNEKAFDRDVANAELGQFLVKDSPQRPRRSHKLST